jgi:hypothetical protein
VLRVCSRSVASVRLLGLSGNCGAMGTPSTYYRAIDIDIARSSPAGAALQNLSCSASGSACCRLAINTMKLLLLTLLLSLAVDSANSCKSDLDCAHVTSPRPSHSRSANHDCAVGLRVSIHRRPWQADPLAMARARVHRLAERGL